MILDHFTPQGAIYVLLIIYSIITYDESYTITRFGIIYCIYKSIRSRKM